MDIKKVLTENFLRYTSVESQSNSSSSVVPSSEGQKDIIKLLYNELKEFGAEDLHIDEYYNLTCKFSGNLKGVPSIGFCSHIDTVDVGISPVIKAQLLKFDGSPVVLNKDLNIVFNPSEHKHAKNYIGQEIFFTDGTSVLGADNKAATAIVMATVRRIKEYDVKHGDIYISFVPDEEIGLKGAKLLDLDRYKPDYSYTIDASYLGEVNYETFNAAKFTLNIEGVTAHPIAAKGILVNPILIASDFISMFDRLQTPENTEGKEGYIWSNSISGNQSSASVSGSIRDFNLKQFELKKELIKSNAAKLQKENPKAKISVTITDQYSNIADFLKSMKPVDFIFEGMKNIGVEVIDIPIRGGTDGSALSARGLPTPNYFTGAHELHSKWEYLPLDSFIKSYELTQQLIHLVANRG